MAQALKGTSLNAQKPRLHATLPDGSRVAIAIPPMSYGGITLTIRKHRETAYSLEELVDSGTLPPAVLSVLAPAIQRPENPASIAISGATGSGKTSLLNALLTLIDPTTRVGFIEEDAAEIKKTAFRISSRL
jgi:pilus assembly protein CpaF